MAKEAQKTQAPTTTLVVAERKNSPGPIYPQGSVRLQSIMEQPEDQGNYETEFP
jgi:hypothetical protein